MYCPVFLFVCLFFSKKNRSYIQYRYFITKGLRTKTKQVNLRSGARICLSSFWNNLSGLAMTSCFASRCTGLYWVRDYGGQYDSHSDFSNLKGIQSWAPRYFKIDVGKNKSNRSKNKAREEWEGKDIHNWLILSHLSVFRRISVTKGTGHNKNKLFIFHVWIRVVLHADNLVAINHMISSL